MSRVGVRELRQNLSVYLRRVKNGETLEVTEHGQPVARLAPLPGREDARSRLIAEGKLIPGTQRWEDLPPPPPLPPGMRPLTETLEEMRDEERF